MEKFLYNLFVAADAWVAGAAGFGAVLMARLAMLTRGRERRRYIYMSLAKAGYSITSAILLYAVAIVGTIEANPRAFGYLAGLLMAGVGFTGVAALARDDLVDREVDYGEKHDEGA